ncbi:MAG: hypothetical protein ACPGSO_02845 [Vicingaceae bacterium]
MSYSERKTVEKIEKLKLKLKKEGIKIKYLSNFWVMGMAINHYIFILNGKRKPLAELCLLNHEYIHILQQNELGFLRFVFIYLFYSVKYGYDKNPFEIEAYKFQGFPNYYKVRNKKAWKQFIQK